jgi:hypothetical protein
MRRLIINGTKRGSLNNEQEQFVRENRMTMDVQDMAEKLKVPTTRIYSFFRFYKLEYKMRRPASGKLQTSKEGMFMVEKRKDWIF